MSKSSPQQDIVSMLSKRRGHGLLERLPISDRLSYLEAAKLKFQNQPESYSELLETIKALKSDIITPSEAYAKVKGLLHGSMELIESFSLFLPDTYQLSNDELLHNKEVGVDDAKMFLNKVHAALLDEPDAYQAFLEVLYSYQHNKFPLEDVCAKVTVLFQNEKELIRNFQQFIPDSTSFVETDTLSQHLQSLIKRGAIAIEQDYPQTERINIEIDPGTIPPIPDSIPSYETTAPLVDEVKLFETIKDAIKDKQVYSEFLKTLNLYTQDVIDLPELIQKVEAYFGSYKELYAQFLVFAGYNRSTPPEDSIVQKKRSREEANLNTDGTCTGSYKRLTNSETIAPCSGRDKLCWKVLNDEWVAHPVWASEDAGFISHRKNHYEETLFKIEEERHEYDHYIELNYRVIEILEAIMTKISTMSDKERKTFRLPPNLGSNSVMYQKIIRKVYHRTRANEIIEAVQERPSVAVPILLKRLKEKDKEWNMAKREWNKVWRELEQKVFFKSLDHLGLMFKHADKRLLTESQVIQEIKCIKLDQQIQSTKRDSQEPQLQYAINDLQVFEDIIQLFDSSVARSTVYSTSEKTALLHFIRQFIGIISGIEVQDYQDFDLNSKKSYVRSTLSKRLLQSQSWVLGKLGALLSGTGSCTRSLFNIYSAPDIYAFFRFLMTIYERLSEVKSLNIQVQKEVNSRTVPQFALDLKLVPVHMAHMRLDFLGVEDFYKQVIALSQRMIQGDLEHQWFEESLRQCYRNKAYKLYTIDKAIHTLAKKANEILKNAQSMQVMALIQNDRKNKSTTYPDQVLYYKQCRSLIGKENDIFRLEVDETTHQISVSYLPKNEIKNSS